MYYRLFGRLYTVWSGSWPTHWGRHYHWQLGYASYWKDNYKYTKFIRLDISTGKLWRKSWQGKTLALSFPHIQTAELAKNKKGQTMSNAHEIIEVKKDEVVKTLPLQGSDEVQLTITVQEPEDIEKKPTLH